MAVSLVFQRDNGGAVKKRYLALLIILLTLIHLALSAVCIGKATYAYQSEELLERWQAITSVVTFPLVYLERLHYLGPVPKFLDFDWLPLLVMANSTLWGLVSAFLIVWVVGRRKSTKAAV